MVPRAAATVVGTGDALSDAGGKQCSVVLPSPGPLPGHPLPAPLAILGLC